jgi:glycosyltransferase involved in cell wall biosynthesis
MLRLLNKSMIKDSKTILFVVNTPNFFLSHRLPLAVAAKKAGFNVHVATKNGSEISQITKHGLVHHIIPFDRSGHNVFSDITTLKSLVKLFKDIRPNLVHLVTIKPVIYGGIAARIAGIQSVVAAISGLGTAFIDISFYGSFRRLLILKLYKEAFKQNRLVVIFQNQDDLQIFKTKNLVNDKSCRIIRGSGVKLSDYPFLPEPNSTPIVVMAARLLKDKGVFEFIQSAKILKDKGEKVIFRLIGETDFDNRSGITKTILNKWEVDGFVELLGYKHDIANQYARANIICLPSYREGLPKSLVEAAACGRAIITTDVPGCRDAIIPGITGLLCPVKDSNALANAILKLAKNPNKRKKMGKAGRELAQTEFSIEKIVKKHMDIYQELINL